MTCLDYNEAIKSPMAKEEVLLKEERVQPCSNGEKDTLDIFLQWVRWSELIYVTIQVSD